MNKDCQGCMKIFSFDERIYPNRKFCSKECYLIHIKKKPAYNHKESKLKKWFKKLFGTYK